MCKTYVSKICKAKGLTLVDADGPLIVGVGVDDIIKARTKNSKCCAFARASKREPGVRAAYFFRSTAFLEFDDRMVRFRLPPAVQKEIVSFDRAGIMAPGEYKIIAPQPSRTPERRAAMKAAAKRRAKAVRLREGDPSRPQLPPTFIARAPSRERIVTDQNTRLSRRTAYLRTTDEPK